MWQDLRFAAGVSFDKASIVDVAPTVLYLAGVPAPRDMDGRALTEMFEPDFVASRPQTYSDGSTRSDVPARYYSAEEEEQLMKRLRDLGYV